MDFNSSFAQWLFSFSSKSSFLDWIIIFFAQYLPYLLVLAFLGFLLTEPGRRRLLLFLEAALAIFLARGILTEGIRFFHPVARPFEAWEVIPLVSEALNNSFPSGHAAFYFALATVLFLGNRAWGIWFFLCAVLIGVARVAAGVHWPMDIVGGALLGVIAASFVHILLKRPSEALSSSREPSPSADEPTSSSHTLP